MAPPGVGPADARRTRAPFQRRSAGRGRAAPRPPRVAGAREPRARRFPWPGPRRGAIIGPLVAISPWRSPMAAIRLVVNGQARTADVAPDTPLLWVLRDALGLTGTKYSCGAGLCGACTVLLDGEPARSCQVTAAQAAGRKVTTIEGLSPDRSHPLQKAWLEEQVPQCGYCPSGQLMAAAALLA